MQSRLWEEGLCRLYLSADMPHKLSSCQKLGCVLMQAQNAQAAGAKALLVYDDQISDYFVPASDGTITGISIPSGSIPRRTGQLLVSSLLVSCPPGPVAVACAVVWSLQCGPATLPARKCHWARPIVAPQEMTTASIPFRACAGWREADRLLLGSSPAGKRL